MDETVLKVRPHKFVALKEGIDFPKWRRLVWLASKKGFSLNALFLSRSAPLPSVV